MSLKNKNSLVCLLFFSAFYLYAETGDLAEMQELPEVEVIEPASVADSESNFSGIKAIVSNKELPLVVEKLSTEILQNLRSKNLESLLDGYTSGSASPAEGGINSTVILRGFNDSSFSRNGLNDSLSTVPLREVANIESVEVLKGANSVLYGAGEPGGTINIITKQPQSEPMHSLQVGIGNYDRYRAELDSTGLLSGNDKLAYRMIAVYENADSNRDFVGSNKIFAAPSVRWQPDSNWSLLGEAEFIQQEQTFDTGVIAVDERFPLPQSRFLGEPGLGDTRLQTITTSVNVEYSKSDDWQLSAKLLLQNSDIDGLRVEPDGLENDNPGEFLLSRQVQQESDDVDAFAAQIEYQRTFIGKATKQQLLLGYEFSMADNHAVLSESDVDAESFEIDIFDVVYGQNTPSLFSSRNTNEVLQQHSFYLQDFINIGERLIILLGTRFDKFDIDSKDTILGTDFVQNKSVVSLRTGIVYSLNSKLSFFASYGESTDPNEGLTPDGRSLKPSRGKSAEGGIKFQQPFLNLSVDASFYSAEKTNVAVDAPGAPGFEIQTARQKSQGFDGLLSVDLASWLKVNVNYAYTDAEIFDDPEIPDRTRPINVPLHKLVLSGFFSFNIRNENDFQAGLVFSYRSAQKASQDADELGVELPGYWLGNLFINYSVSPRVSLGLGINNIMDKNYLAATQVDLLHIHPGSPFEIIGSIKLSF